MSGGGAQYFKYKIVSCERRRRKVMLVGSGHALPDFFYKRNGTSLQSLETARRVLFS